MDFNKLLCFLSLSIIFHAALAQKEGSQGYIITNSSDTIHGYIDAGIDASHAKTCRFKEDIAEAFKSYSPTEIKGYRIQDSKYYISKNMTLDSVDTQLFLEFLVDGIVDLYFLRVDKQDIFFVEKGTKMYKLTTDSKTIVDENGDKYVKKSDQYRRVLMYLFQDAPTMNAKISTINFGHRPLINLTKEYHDATCEDFSCIDYSKSTKTNTFFEPTITIRNTTMQLRDAKETSDARHLSLGAMFRFQSFRNSGRWNLVTGLEFRKENYQGLYRETQPTPLRTRSTFNYSSLSIPLSIEYSLGTNKIQPFLYASAGISFIIDNDIIVEVSPFQQFFRQPEFEEVTKLQLNYAIGTGLRYMIQEKSYIKLSLGYEKRRSIAENEFADGFHFRSLAAGLTYGMNIR